MCDVSFSRTTQSEGVPRHGATRLTFNGVLHVGWCKVESSLGVAVGEVGVGPMTQEEGAYLAATFGGSLMHWSELPQISCIHLCTILEGGLKREGRKGDKWGNHRCSTARIMQH